MRKALVVGIDHHELVKCLHGCVHDAKAVAGMLERNGDGSPNFGVRLRTVSGPQEALSRRELKACIRELFAGEGEIALLYFAGHGFVESAGGYILASESRSGDEGLPLSEVLTYAGKSKASHKVVLLDSCYSGSAGARASDTQWTELADGLTILTASTAEQYADETSDGGVFTNLLVDALNGAAANLVGEITPGSVYAHIDQSLGPWQQRPVFKTNIKGFVSLRRVRPPIDLRDLRRITELFPFQGWQVKLDPSFEPEGPCPDPDNTEKLALLQKYNRLNLVVPVGAPHMYHAAMESKECRLTVLGEHWRSLVERGRL